jgi:4-hydroxy-2-oxoheptanedioate aldolase
MRENRLRRLWTAGEKTVNGWLAIPNGFSAEVMAHQGFDSLTIDMQHGIVDYQAAVSLLQAISTTDAVPMVRVPWNEPGVLQKMLDAGAYGVICPMINSRAEARAFVSACRYPPLGSRSFGPIRATIYGGADYPKHANDAVLTLAMIETRQAMDELAAILEVEGLDGIYVGPADLAISLGCTPGFDPEEKTVVDAIRTIIDTTRRHRKFAGIHCGSPAYIKRMWSIGFDYATLLSDARMMAMKAAELLPELKDRSGGPASSTY